MSDLKHIIAIAQQALEEHGDNAAAIMEERALNNRLQGDLESAALWGRVAAAIKAIEASPDGKPIV